MWKVLGNIYNVNKFKENNLLGFLLMNLLKPFLTVRSEPNALVSEIQQQQSTKQIGHIVRTFLCFFSLIKFTETLTNRLAACHQILKYFSIIIYISDLGQKIR